MNSFYTREELNEICLAKIGSNVLISRKSSIYSASKISLGNNVRIDDFCILSGKITIGNYIHIASYSALYGGDEGIQICDYAGISSKNSIYAISEDYSGESMTNPMIPNIYKNIYAEKAVLNKHLPVGAGCVILPGVVLGEGNSFGAMSLIDKDSEPWTINAGIPFKKIKRRSREILNLAKQFEKEVMGDV